MPNLTSEDKIFQEISSPIVLLINSNYIVAPISRTPDSAIQGWANRTHQVADLWQGDQLWGAKQTWRGAE